MTSLFGEVQTALALLMALWDHQLLIQVPVCMDTTTLQMPAQQEYGVLLQLVMEYMVTLQLVMEYGVPQQLVMEYTEAAAPVPVLE